MSGPANDANAHLAGHRQRLRERFRKTGERGMSDHELLELMLFGILPRRDTKPIAKALLARFGTLHGVVGAEVADLARTDGVGEAAALYLKAAEAVLVRAAWGQAREDTVLSSWSAVLNYLRMRLALATREEFRCLFVDKRHRLIDDMLMGMGTVDQAPVYPREIARTALELSASRVILCHNHPSGDPSPSSADIAITREVIAALKPLGIDVLDHVIVGRDGTRSLKALGLI